MLRIRDAQLTPLIAAQAQAERRDVVSLLVEHLLPHYPLPREALRGVVTRALEAAEAFEIIDLPGQLLWVRAHLDAGCAFWEIPALAEHLADPLLHPFSRATQVYAMRFALRG